MMPAARTAADITLKVKTRQLDRRRELAAGMRTGGAPGQGAPGEARYAAANCGAS